MTQAQLRIQQIATVDTNQMGSRPGLIQVPVYSIL